MFWSVVLGVIAAYLIIRFFWVFLFCGLCALWLFAIGGLVLIYIS